MPKPMPKSALPRDHPKHPSQCSVIYKTRRLLNKHAGTARSQIDELFTSDYAFQRAIASRLDWFGTDGDRNRSTEADFAQAVEDVLSLPMEAFVAYRHLQQALNRVRKLLQDGEPHEISCCVKAHFVDSLFAFSAILQGNLCHAIVYRKDATTDFQRNKGLCDYVLTKEILQQAARAGKARLARTDKFSILLDDIITTGTLWEQYDVLRALVVHVKEHPSDRDRLEPNIFATTVDQGIVQRSLIECVYALAPGPGCAKCSLFRRQKSELTTLVTTQYYACEPYFFGFHKGTFRNVVSHVFAITKDPFHIPIPLLRTAAIEQVRQRCASLSTRNSVLQELLRTLEVSQHHPMKVRPVPYTPADPRVEPREDFKDAKPVDLQEQTHEEGDSSIQVPSPVSMDVTVSTKIEEGASFERMAKSTRMVEEVDCPSPRLSIIEKYRARGYALGSPRSLAPVREDITKRIWTIEDHTEYYDVWRVIFPVTRSDRLVTRVSWPLFLKAMQAAPLNCRIKRAADPIFVFERRNEDFGKEIFECHAPHGMDWIPASDLYRYKKDLRDTFGMDADRIVLETEKEPRKN